MLVSWFVRLVLAASVLFGQSVIARKHCHNPSVRREWRSMASYERAEWINAVKVESLSSDTLSTADTFAPSVSTDYLIIHL